MAESTLTPSFNSLTKTIQYLDLSLSLSPISPLEQQQQEKQKQKQQEEPKIPPYLTKKELEDFVVVVKKYGKGLWKQIALDYCPSKTATQISTHAQTFLKKTELVYDLAMALAANSVVKNHMEVNKILKRKLVVQDDHKDDDDDDDVIVLDSMPDLLPRKVKRTTMDLLPLVDGDYASSSGKQDAEQGKEEEGGDDQTMDLFPTHPIHII